MPVWQEPPNILTVGTLRNPTMNGVGRASVLGDSFYNRTNSWPKGGRRCAASSSLCCQSLPLFLAPPAVFRRKPDSRPRLQKLSVPAAQTKLIATKLSLQYRDVPGVRIAPDVRNEEFVVMAPEATQKAIAKEVKAMLASHMLPSPGAIPVR